MSIARKIRRAQTRDMEAIHLALLAPTEPRTKNTRMALAGNTSSGMRRRSAHAIRAAEQRFKPEATSKVIQHKSDALLMDSSFQGEQTINGFTKFIAPKVHAIALYIAQKARKDRETQS